MEGNTPGRDEYTPEVETSVAVEDVKYPDSKLNCHPERNGSEDGDQGPGFS